MSQEKNTKKQTEQVKLNVDETKAFLKYIIKNNQHLQEEGKNLVSVEIEGESGYGKTSAVIQLAKECELNFVKLNLTQIEELGDLVGFPIRQFELRKHLEEGKIDVRWVDENLLDDYVKRMGYEGTGKNRMSYCPPEWISGKEEGGILLLDDWNRADMRFIQAVMELVDRQQYISWTLPKNWHILLTSNPDNGEYLVNAIDAAQRTRFIKINLKFDIDCWAKWAEFSKVDGRCINFMIMHPEIIKGTVNARSMTTFFNSISSIQSFENELPLIEMIGEGSVGPEVAQLFVMFINNRLDKIIAPDKVIFGEEKHVLDTLVNLIGTNEGKSYRADIASAVATRVVNYMHYYIKDKPVTDSIIKRLSKVVTSKVFNTDICYSFVKQIYNADINQFKMMLMDKGLVSYIMK